MELENLADEISRLQIDNARKLSYLAHTLSKSGEAGVLIWLSRQDDTAYAIDIVEHFGLTPGRVANIIKKLEQRGYIERCQDRTDQRKVRILLTEPGRAYADAQYAQMNAAHVRLVRTLGEDDTRQLMELLRRCFSAADAMTKSVME